MSKCSRKYLNNHQVKVLLSILLLIAYSLPLNATVRYVSKTGNSTPPYITWETAADSIQKCINVCVFGDTIYVANGVYEEEVEMINGLALIGGGMDSCIVDARSFAASGSVAIAMKDSCLIKGFYIFASNNFNYGYGIYTFGQTGLITLNKFSNANTGIILNDTHITAYKNYFFNVRRGIAVGNSNSIVRKNEIFILTNTGGVSCIWITAFDDSYQPIIDSNYIVSKYGTGIYKSLGASPIIKNNFIQFVQYGVEGIFLLTSNSAKVFNNLIQIGTGQIGIDNYNVYNVNYLKVTNNYIFGKETNSPQGMYVSDQDTVKNNVITNTVRGIVAGNPQNLVTKYNNLWNNEINYTNLAPDTTNISVNPMVINNDSTQGKLDFHLQKFSPLIDAGDPNILDKDSSRSDIGLYGGPYGESYIYIDLPPRTPVNLTANIDSNIVTLKWNKNTESDFSYYNLFYDTTKNFQIDSTKLISSQSDTFYYFVIPPETDSLYFKLTAIDNQGNESNPSEEVGVVVTSVEDEWKPVNNYILYQNYPNPFNPSTKIGYKLKEGGYVKLYVYDIKGELVSVLVNEVQQAGYYEVLFDALISHSGEVRNLPAGRQGLASGVYIYQIFVKGENNIPVFSDIKKMLLVK
ncbi:MAG: hypothetical protein DAHOPDDO_02809 [Ignavibacteriaceae bacterium]|nr:hypothetical protein [Ignavibacteriaceae bacterium]